MTIDAIRQALLWCFVINMGILLWWFLFFMLAHGFMYKMHSKWFRISVEKFDAVHYLSMAVFKLLIFVFNLVPFIALSIIK
jgi:hypothetical protein